MKRSQPLKRSWIKRGTSQLKRSKMKRIGKQKREEFTNPLREKWSRKFDFCFRCGARGKHGFPRSTHESIGGAYRNQTVWLRAFWIRLCTVPCHREAASMPNREQLLDMMVLKMKHDPKGFSMAAYNAIWHEQHKRTPVTWDELHSFADAMETRN